MARSCGSGTTTCTCLSTRPDPTPWLSPIPTLQSTRWLPRGPTPSFLLPKPRLVRSLSLGLIPPRPCAKASTHPSPTPRPSARATAARLSPLTATTPTPCTGHATPHPCHVVCLERAARVRAFDPFFFPDKKKDLGVIPKLINSNSWRLNPHPLWAAFGHFGRS